MRLLISVLAALSVVIGMVTVLSGEDAAPIDGRIKTTSTPSLQASTAAPEPARLSPPATPPVSFTHSLQTRFLETMPNDASSESAPADFASSPEVREAFDQALDAHAQLENGNWTEARVDALVVALADLVDEASRCGVLETSADPANGESSAGTRQLHLDVTRGDWVLRFDHSETSRDESVASSVVTLKMQPKDGPRVPSALHLTLVLRAEFEPSEEWLEQNPDVAWKPHVVGTQQLLKSSALDPESNEYSVYAVNDRGVLVAKRTRRGHRNGEPYQPPTRVGHEHGPQDGGCFLLREDSLALLQRSFDSAYER